MPTSNYKRYSLRTRVFSGFIIICVLSMASAAYISYLLLKRNAEEQSKTDMQNRTNQLMAALDYAVSLEPISTEQIPEVLGSKILEISDITKQDIIIYDLNGQYILSNRQRSQVSQKEMPESVLHEVITYNRRVDIKEYDQAVGANKTSSYITFQNNAMEPIGVVYFPYYHSDSAHVELLNKYVKLIALVNIGIIALSILLSWFISKNLTKAISNFSDIITRITLFDKDMAPIKYYQNDELGALVKAYNKMILQIQDHKDRLAFSEKEKAWREMAKQVAHEVKNPLTPMKLTIQNFARRFDPDAPDIKERLREMTDSVVDQIDLVATVATAFSQFAQLPEKKNETFNLNNEIDSILRIFNNDRIFVHANKEDIMVNMDRIYLNRILTNLITNAKQAVEDHKQPIINVDVEQINKRVVIFVEDNGVGIPENMQERIFEPSFTSKSSGMGLGLTMVRKMVEDYGGEITVKSEVGKGAKFIISLPNNL